MKRKKVIKTAVIILMILLLLAFAIGAYMIYTVVRWHYETIATNIERYPEEFDSYDGKYTLQTVVEEGEEGSGTIHYVNILIVDNTIGEEVLSIERVYRVFDFHWAIWEKDNYNFWLKSGDIGTFYYEYQEDGGWKKYALVTSDGKCQLQDNYRTEGIEIPYEDIIARLPDGYEIE